MSKRVFPWRIYVRVVLFQAFLLLLGLAGAGLAFRRYFQGEISLALRGALAQGSLEHSLATLDTALLLFLIAVACSLGFFALWSARALLLPIGRLLQKTRTSLEPGDVEDLEGDSFGEWSELESSIDDIRRDLRAKAESLSVEREELSTLMSAISDAILAVDPEGRPLFFNSRFALLVENEEELRRRDVRLWEMFRAPEVLEAFRSVLGGGGPAHVKAISIEQGPGKRFYSVSVSPLRKRDGAVYGAVGVFHDVTELKSAEQIRIDFVANVSHELRTPLTAIKGYTDTLIQDMADGRGASKEFLDIIARNVERLMALIRDLLDLSSLESTDILHKARIRTDEVTSRIVGQLQVAFDGKQQTIEQAIQAGFVDADSRRLEQVLTNLLENAHKYTPAGGSIRVSWEAEAGGAVLLKVADNGPGIPLEHHSRLFERFYRVDKARSREQGGTGLGLAIVKHIVQRHQGAVWVESQPGRGSTFICRFPA